LTGKRVNASLEMYTNPDSLVLLKELVDASRGASEGTTKCTITKSRIAKTAIVLGVQLLLLKTPEEVLNLVEKWAPVYKAGSSGPYRHGLKLRAHMTLFLECSSTPCVLECVERAWRYIRCDLSQSRVIKTAFCVGLYSIADIEPCKLRLLVSKVCPVPRKYFDAELNQWL
jgi:hypothetical protein